jgi:putative ABC transport system permease protein
MFVFESIVQAWHSLRRNKLRTGLTMFGIIWGITSMITLVGMGKSAQKLFYGEFKKIGEKMVFLWSGTSSSGLAGIKGGRAIRFTIDDVNAITAHCPEIELVSPQIRIGYREAKYGGDALACETWGVDENSATIRNQTIDGGRFLVSDDIELSRRVCVLGASVREKLFGARQAVGEHIRLDGIRFQVVGVFVKKGDQLSRFSTLDDDQITIPYTTVQRLFTGSRFFGLMALQPRSLMTEELAMEEVAETLAVRHGFEPDDPDAIDSFGTSEMLGRVSGVTIGMQIFLGAASIVTLLIGGIGVMNIMFVSINERIREIGIIKAIGAKKRQVFLQFLIESIFVTFLAGFTGIFLGCALCLAIGLFELPRLVAAPQIDPMVIAISFLTMTAVGVFSGVLPALRASRMQIAEALRLY